MVEDSSPKIEPVANHELPPKELEFPFEYFDAQVRFAYKWSEITGIPLEVALLNKTALYRRLTNNQYKSGQTDSRWNNLMKTISSGLLLDETSNLVFDTYKVQDHAAYSPHVYPENDGKHFGFFGFDYPANDSPEGQHTVKVHFLNPKRGEKSSLHPDFMAQRRADLAKMFSHIRKTFPEASEVIGGSWLYHIPQYRDSFPTEFTKNMKRLVPKGFEDKIPNSVAGMEFSGNSLWGQFVNRNGGPRQKTYDSFVEALNEAKTEEDLINAFPFIPYQPKASIEIFYSGIGASE
jgi:hypothetical protein